MENELSYILDTSKPFLNTLKCKELDNRPLILTLYDRGTEYNLSGATFELKAKKPDSTFVIQTNNITYTNNIVTINPLNVDIVRLAGIVSLELKITKSSLSVTTFTFEIEVMEGVIQSTNQPSQNLVTVIEELDQTILQAEIQKQDLTALNATCKVVLSTDGTAISSELSANALGGYKSVFPKTVIELTQSILIPSNADIDFNNATIKRKAGPTNILDLIKNTDSTNGNTNIKIANLLIDGNRQADNLSNAIDSQRFSGLKLTKVSGASEIRNVTVINTVNGEDLQTTPAGGIFYVECTGIKFFNINGWDNLGTAILNRLSTKCEIDGSLTYNNTGSGISGRGTNECKFLNITTYNNSLSNLSVNGLRCIIDNVISSGAGYSGVNIGHDTTETYSHDCIASNICSYNNNYEGITITASDRVKLSNVNVYGNAIDNTRENIRIILSNYSKLVNIESHDCINQAIRYYNGVGHTIDSSNLYNCSVGVYVDSGVNVTVGNTVKIHGNTSDGITLVSSANCSILGAEIYSNTRYGLLISGGSGHIINNINIYSNGTNIFESNTPTNIYYSYSIGNIKYLNNGFAEFLHNKSVSDEILTSLFEISMPNNSRCVIDFVISGAYPASTSASVISVRGLATCVATGAGTMVNDISTTLISSSAVSGVTSTLTASITNDETNDKFTFNVTQNNEPADAALNVTVKANITFFSGSILTKPAITLL